jgi:hypothetical protein
MLSLELALFRQDSSDEDVLHVDKGSLQSRLEETVWHPGGEEVPEQTVGLRGEVNGALV